MYHPDTSEARRIRPRIGDVYMIQFDGSGSVQQGYRPGVVFSNNAGNASSPNVIVYPMTTSLKKMSQPTHVVLDAASCGLKYTSMVLCENPQCIPKTMLGRFISHLDDIAISRIAVAQLVSSAGIAFVDFRTIADTREIAVKMNAAL